jgi:phosphoglycerol transferase MdoB-like AlkP superfamily enzyme
MSPSVWYGRVFLRLLLVNSVLAAAIALVTVSGFVPPNPGSDVIGSWILFGGLGLIAAVVLVSITTSVSALTATVLTRWAPSLPRPVVVAISLIAPGLIALLFLEPWRQPSIALVYFTTPAFLLVLGMGIVAAIVVVVRADRAAAPVEIDARSDEAAR